MSSERLSTYFQNSNINFRTLIGKLEAKRLLERPKHSWEDVKMIFKLDVNV
jgi:hypothetical protein